MSGGAGAGETRSRCPLAGATVEPAKARRTPAHARHRGSDPGGALFRPSTRPVSGDATREGREPPTWDD